MKEIIHNIELLELQLSRLKSSVKSGDKKETVQSDYNKCSNQLSKVMVLLQKKYGE